MNNLLRASLIHFKSKEAEAIAVLEAFCNKHVAVADHSNLVGEINDWVSKLADAQDSIRTLTALIESTMQPQSDLPPKTTPENSSQEGQ